MKVLFCEFTLPFESNGQKLVGWSTTVYGESSRWNDDYKGQTIEVEFPNRPSFLACLRDLTMTYTFIGRRWVPVEVEAIGSIRGDFVRRDLMKHVLPPYFTLKAEAKKLGLDVSKPIKSQQLADAIAEAKKERGLVSV